jgi:hypothetical protein
MEAHGAVLNPLSKRIIGCGLKVAGTLGNGLLRAGLRPDPWAGHDEVA